MLVSEDSTCGEKGPIQIGTLHIDRVLDLATVFNLKINLKKLNHLWKRGRLATVLAARSAQITSQGQFHLDQVRGNVKQTKSIEIHPFETVHMYTLKSEGTLQKSALYC